MKKYFKSLLFDIRFRIARREANRLRAVTGCKHLVICFDGRPLVTSKRRIKELVADGYFRKGVRAADIERNAIYSTI